MTPTLCLGLAMPEDPAETGSWLVSTSRPSHLLAWLGAEGEVVRKKLGSNDAEILMGI